jgi:hypothetical protein
LGVIVGGWFWLQLGRALAQDPEAPAEPIVPTDEAPADLPPADDTPDAPLDDAAPGAAVAPVDETAGSPLPDVVILEFERRKPNVTRLFSNDFELRLWQTDDRVPGFEDRRVLDYVEQVDRFTATVRVDRWSLYAQLDQVALMANTYFLDDERQQERELLAPGTWSVLIPGRFDPTSHTMNGWGVVSRNLFVTLEKLRLEYEAPKLKLTVGDAYAAFGRGMALNLNRNVDIDLDTSLQGVEAIAHLGAWDVTALFGQANRQQVFQDNPNRGLAGDRRHMIGGLRIERFGLGPASLGAHGVVYNFVDETGWTEGFAELATTPDVVVGGANVELLGLGPTDWYFEGNGFAFPTVDAFGGEEVKPGYGLYLSSAVYAGKVQLLFEGKRYYNTERVNALLTPELYEIAVAPTLEYERAITEDSAAALNSNDAWGGRLRASVSAIPGILVPYASMAVFRDLDLGSLHFNREPETILHPVVGLELIDGEWSTIFNAGYRVDLRDGDQGGADRQLHGDVLSRFPLGHELFFDVSIGAEWYRWGNNPLQQTDYAEMESALSLQWGRLMTFTWFTDFSTNPLIDSVGNLSDAWYGAAEIQVQPLPALTLRAFYGAYKSGIRCSGGQCRVLPGFEGARLSVTASF